jgi:transposase
MRQLQPCLLGMEACGGAHYWAREMAKLGHEVRLMSPQFVRPYVKSNKNDAKDAEAICEAVGRPSMRFVAIKSQSQQDMMALHRVRSLLIRERTALKNEMRGLLAECGVIAALGASARHRLIATIMAEPDDRVSGLLREILSEMNERLRLFEERLKHYDLRIAELARTDERAGRLMAVQGVGPLQRHRAYCSSGRRSTVPQRAGIECLAGVGSAPVLERRARQAARHQQTRRPVSAHVTDPWRAHHPAHAGSKLTRVAVGSWGLENDAGPTSPQ